MKETLDLTKKQILNVNGCVRKWHPAKNGKEICLGEYIVGSLSNSVGYYTSVRSLDELKDAVPATAEEVAHFDYIDGINAKSMMEYYDSPGYKGD